MKRSTLSVAGLLLGLFFAQAQALSPGDFAVGLPIITTQESAAYRFALLAFGSATAIRAEADLNQIPATLQIAAATVGAPQVLGGPSRLVGKSPDFPWMRAVLWVVLLLAVILLGWMAYRLAKEPGPLGRP